MNLLKKILFLLFLGNAAFLCAQTPGINYQAIILNNATIEIPGTDVAENQVPLGLEEITFRFSISNDLEIEYIEEQTVFTDKNGMISLIVGDGNPINATFSDIVWDGQLKFLNVEINILSDNDGFVFLDTQKILYVPHPSNGTSQVFIMNSLEELTPPYNKGDLIWTENYDESGNPSIMIYDGTAWKAANIIQYGGYFATTDTTPQKITLTNTSKLDIQNASIDYLPNAVDRELEFDLDNAPAGATILINPRHLSGVVKLTRINNAITFNGYSEFTKVSSTAHSYGQVPPFFITHLGDNKWVL